MKKFGRYEKQPEAKSVLLQTYLTSLLCMVLCVTMFFGTTYAWFTAEVSNEGNEIYVGVLNVGLYKIKDGNAVNLNSEESNEKLFDGNICWEPGYTSIETVQIKNEGDLSFRYALTFSGALKDSDDKELLRKVAKNFAVYVHPGDYAEGEEKPGSFADIEKSERWKPVCMGKDPATLADILEKGLPVFTGNMEAKDEVDTYILAMHMLETAGEGATEADSIALSEELMGKRIGLNVKVTAYQRTHEQDAFGAGYDLQAHVIDLGAMTIDYKRWPNYNNTPSGETIDLDATYQFLPVESSEEGQNSPYKKYFADFVITAERPVALNTIALAGYYEFFCEDWNGGDWIVLESDDTKVINPGEEVPLVGSMGGGLDITYDMLCDYGNDGIGFLCGLKNRSPDNIGNTITVELRVYETQLNENNNNEIVDITDYIVAGRKIYTIEKFLN